MVLSLLVNKGKLGAFAVVFLVFLVDAFDKFLNVS